MAEEKKTAEKPVGDKSDIIETKKFFFKKTKNYGWAKYRSTGTLVDHSFTYDQVVKMVAEEKAKP